MKKLKLFISSVQSEFAEERRMLKHYINTDALLGTFFDVFIFEDMPAYEDSVQHVYLKEVADCDIYIGLIGTLYGYEELATQATSFVMSRIDNWVGVRNVPNTAAVPTRSELPMEAVQEAIVNAICHRDYHSNGSVQVMLFRNRLEIWNPGSLPQGVTTTDLYLPHSSIPANPLIAESMYLNGYIEKIGSGTEDIVRRCTDYGLKEPIFQQGNTFKVIIWRAEEVDGVRRQLSNVTDNGSNVTDNVSEGNDNVKNFNDNGSNESDNVSAVIEKLPSSIIINILSFIDHTPSHRKDILLNAGLSNHSYNINRYIKPLIEGGLIRVLNRKVNIESRKDLLTITEKGTEYLNQLKKQEE